MFWNALPLWSLCSSGGITQQVSNSPSQLPSPIAWLSVRDCSRYKSYKIACRRRRRPTLEHLVSPAANGPLESPAAEATSLSKLKVLLAKYNLITYMRCHYNFTIKDIQFETPRAGQAEVCMGNTLHSPMELWTFSNCSLNLNAKVSGESWQCSPLLPPVLKGTSREQGLSPAPPDFSFHFRAGDLQLHLGKGSNSPLVPPKAQSGWDVALFASLPVGRPWHCTRSRTLGIKQPRSRDVLWC